MFLHYYGITFIINKYPYLGMFQYEIVTVLDSKQPHLGVRSDQIKKAIGRFKLIYIIYSDIKY